MTTTPTAATIFDLFPFEATRQQAEALYRLEDFVSTDCTADAFILRGAAGTGKTSLVKAVVDFLNQQEIGFCLTAPTGRAAKVLGYKTQVMAHTLHHTLYVPIPKNGESERVIMRLRDIEPTPYCVFIVDEASMLSDENDHEGMFCTPNSLLHDLIRYVKACNVHNKIIFIGDIYQLKPIHGESVALDAAYLRQTYRMGVQEIELNEVKRQAEGSSVLNLATDIRERCRLGIALGKLPIFELWNVTAALTYYVKQYAPNQLDRIVMIANSHRNVNWLNTIIRDRLGLTGTLAVGDLVMINENVKVGDHTLVNGDTALVTQIGETKKVADLYFMKVTLQLSDFQGQAYSITHWAMLDALQSERGLIDGELLRSLVADRMKHNSVFRQDPYPWNDEFVGALRLRYGYALTCHKAQGGEWDEVIMHPWFMANDHRYVYTAITRARKRVLTWVKTYKN
jgi:ATP-dependent exoDNAse (exonuclease V) alpha subunit